MALLSIGRVRPKILSVVGLFALTITPDPGVTPAPLSRALAPVVLRYEYHVVGNPGDVCTRTRPGLVLEGGGTDINASFRWMIDRSGGGDFLVIRSSGSDAYNAYIYGMAMPGRRRPDSVATLIIPSRDAAFDPFVSATIRNAEALWIAGGDQARSVALWKGTPVVDAIHSVVAKGAPVGGTSSGLAIMGQFVYAAANDPVAAPELSSGRSLDDPFGHRVTLSRDLLALPNLSGVILDSHFVDRDRMGRLVTFLGRIAQAGWSDEVKGIGIARETALLVEPAGRATVIARPAYTAPSAYFLRMPKRPEVCRAGIPLTARDIEVVRVAPGETFDLRTWTGSGGLTYRLSAKDGRLTASLPGGKIYGRTADRGMLLRWIYP
jgi:cyanophycinase